VNLGARREQVKGRKRGFLEGKPLQTSSVNAENSLAS